jgi:signal transduction histidine kinase
MDSLGALLVEHVDEIVALWRRVVAREALGQHGLSKKELEDSLHVQLRRIGEAIRSGEMTRLAPGELWHEAAALAPEERVLQGVPIEKLVTGYAFVLEAVRTWIQERGYQVPFAEYSFLYKALFELTAESVRRYAAFQAERVSRERALYLAAIAHQMRTPLSALSMQAEMIERKGTAAHSHQTAGLRRNVRRLSHLVTGVMRLERFAAEEIPVNPQPTRVAELVEGIIDDTRDLAERKGLQVVSEVDPSLVAEIDPELLADALGNLIHNAIRYTERGSVRVVVEDADPLLFRVEDTGPGIPDSELPKLYELKKPKTGGSIGLGLLIARRAVLAQGGKIEVETALGRGTVFSFTVPRRPLSRTAAGRPPQAEPQPSP